MAEVAHRILPYTLGNTHPRFWGWVHGSGTPGGIVAQMLQGAINANNGGREHAPVYIERQLLRWMCELFGYPAGASGLMCTGTSAATLYGLAVARYLNTHPKVERVNYSGLEDHPQHALAGRRLILSVTLALPKRWRPVEGYAEVARELRARSVVQPDPHAIFDAVVAIRRRKLPDPAVIGNAGSFFKNPIVSRDEHQALSERYPSLVGYAQPGGRVKLAAGWLIEAVGLKGATRGRAGVYEKQALVLVNRGGATGAEILALAREVQEKVAEAFGVWLDPEPVIV